LRYHDVFEAQRLKRGLANANHEWVAQGPADGTQHLRLVAIPVGPITMEECTVILDDESWSVWDPEQHVDNMPAARVYGNVLAAVSRNIIQNGKYLSLLL
jgi:hypothetical protein